MTSRDFCYWLQGYFELSHGATNLANSQVMIIQNHLKMVFKHEIDPSMPDPDGVLAGIHLGIPPGKSATPTYCAPTPPLPHGGEILRC